uniref:Uncharacterized protein n=1 Tax=Astatotilapia calliptera TaxID=8154 RepID=A0A3P8QTZ8_ASTCA
MKIFYLVLLFQASLQLECDKEITAHVGGEFILKCKYGINHFLYSKKYWCRGPSRSNCEIVADSENSRNTHRSQVIDLNRRGLFVKVTNLRFDDAGAYWVGIDKIYADIMTQVKVIITEADWTDISFFVSVPVSKPRLWPLSSLVDRPTCWGKSVTLRCGCAKGTGVRYAWYQHIDRKDFLLHKSSDLYLHCGAVQKDCSYFCIGSNDISSEKSELISVQVLMPANSSCIYVVNIQGKNKFICQLVEENSLVEAKGGWAGCLYVKVGCLVVIQVTPLIKSSLLVFILIDLYFYFPVTQCESPPVVEYGSFSPNREVYDYKDTIVYTCKSGYTSNGSRQLHCSDEGTFKPEPPKCIKVECEDPEISFGQLSSGARPPYGYSSTVTLQCNAGYTMIGSATVTCGLNSQWWPGLPQCIRYNCGPAEEVENGQIEYRPGAEFGDTAVLICDIGHMPVGGGELTCGSQGWMGRLPVCEVTQCESPPVVEYGSFSPNREVYDYKDTIVYTCKSGYTRNGSRQLDCSDEGTFKPEPPKCIKVECEDPEISFGQLSSGARPPYGYSSTVTLQCNAGYTMIGSATVTCGLNSQWWPGLPQCIPQNCSRPPKGENMDLKGNDILLTSFPDGTTVTFACNTGYESAGGSPRITCTAGSWSSLGLKCQLGGGELTCGSQGWTGRLPVCEVTQCESPPDVQDGTFTPIKELYDYKDVIVYTCKSGYTRNGSRQLDCSDDGTFKPEPPKCIKVECGEPEISFGQWSSGARPPYGYSSTVTLQCNTGYKMIGSATVTCGLNSQWSPGLPRCIRKSKIKISICMY